MAEKCCSEAIRSPIAFLGFSSLCSWMFCAAFGVQFLYIFILSYRITSKSSLYVSSVSFIGWKSVQSVKLLSVTSSWPESRHHELWHSAIPLITFALHFLRQQSQKVNFRYHPHIARYSKNNSCSVASLSHSFFMRMRVKNTVFARTTVCFYNAFLLKRIWVIVFVSPLTGFWDNFYLNLSVVSHFNCLLPHYVI